MEALRGPAVVLAILAFTCAFLVLFRLFRAQRRTLIVTSSLVGAWFLVVGALSLRGFFSDFASLPPHLLLALLLPAVAFAIFRFWGS